MVLIIRMLEVPSRICPTSSMVSNLPTSAVTPNEPRPPSHPQKSTANTTFWTSLVHMPLYLHRVSRSSRLWEDNILVVRGVRGGGSKRADTLNLVFNGIFSSLEHGLDCTRSVRCVRNDRMVLTVGCWRRVGSREDGLCGSALPLEDLQNGPDLLSGFGVVVDLALEALEDLWIYHARGIGHGGGAWNDVQVVWGPSTQGGDGG
jgi:hypothetical protein